MQVVFSKLLRRIHLYLALFLTPWILMYAASTFVMNHRTWFHGDEPAPPRWETVADFVYDGEFPPGAGPEGMAHQLLTGMGMDGAHQAAFRDGRLVINRNRAPRPVRITYTAADRHVVVERQQWEAAGFLERMHRRRGYQAPYLGEDIWAFTVDLTIGAILFWTLSGFWLWWEMRPTRRLGFLITCGGCALFCFFLAVL
jgi:hypothetical protein